MYSQYQKYYRTKSAQAQALWSHSTKRKVLYGFVKNKVYLDYTKELYKRRDALILKRFLTNWLEIYQEETLCKPLFH